jgi:hypothetical protein
MPFDGVGFRLDDRASKIDQVIDLLATSDKWCKGQFRTADGRYCIHGAITVVQGPGFLKTDCAAIRDVTGLGPAWQRES